MPTKNTELIKLLAQIKTLGLFTNSKTHDKVYQGLLNNPHGVDGVQFIVTSGIPDGEAECRECRRLLPNDQFRYFQTRVNSDGTLMRANALCSECAKRDSKKRATSLQGQDIPPKPQSGSNCPKCGRAWSGNWHRDHDHQTGNFRRWLCGQCNMAQHNGRTPDPE